MKSLKTLFKVIACLALFNHTNAQTYLSMTPIIRVVESEIIELDPDEITVEFNVYNETSKTKVKQSLEKLEQQIRNYLKSKKINENQIVSNTDPSTCTYGYSSWSIKKLSSSQYADIKDYFQKNPYIESFYVTNTLLRKETLDKHENTLVKKTIDKAKAKAQEIAKLLNKKILYIQTAYTEGVFDDFEKEMNESYYLSDFSLPKMTLKSQINIEFAVESPNLPAGIEIPRILYVNHSAQESIAATAGELNFTINLLDYESDNPKAEYQKIKSSVEAILKKYGTSLPKSSSENTLDLGEVYNETFTINVKSNIEALFNELNKNQNVTDLSFKSNSKNSDAVLNEINSKLTKKIIEECRAKAEKLAKYLDLTIVKNNDYIDGETTLEYYDNEDLAMEKSEGNASAVAPEKKKIELKDTYTKQGSMSFLIK